MLGYVITALMAVVTVASAILGFGPAQLTVLQYLFYGLLVGWRRVTGFVNDENETAIAGHLAVQVILPKSLLNVPVFGSILACLFLMAEEVHGSLHLL